MSRGDDRLPDGWEVVAEIDYSQPIGERRIEIESSSAVTDEQLATMDSIQVGYTRPGADEPTVFFVVHGADDFEILHGLIMDEEDYYI